MRILILLNEPYPFGMACTNRTHLYAKGLSELNNNVLVIIPVPKDNSLKARNFSRKGSYENVKYLYSWTSSVRNSNFFLRRLHDVFGPFIALIYSIKFKPEFLILVSHSFYHNLIAKLIIVVTKSKLIIEQTEIPYHKKEVISKIDLFKIRIRFWMVKGIILISNPLNLYFRNYLKIRKEILKIPIIVNDEQFTLRESDSKNLVYSGSISEKHAGIFLILEAMLHISAEYKDVKLFITGDKTDSPDLNKINAFIKENSLQDKIIFTGYLSKDDLAKLTHSALALIALKPNNRQSRYNMATKIGEYLKTGRPVMISNVDTICIFLKHRENAFIVKPEVKEIVNEVKFIIENPERAKTIGLNGKKFALTELNYKVQTERLNQFLVNL